MLTTISAATYAPHLISLIRNRADMGCGETIGWPVFIISNVSLVSILIFQMPVWMFLVITVVRAAFGFYARGKR